MSIWGSKKIIIFISFFLLVLVVIEIWVSHTTVSLGEQMNDIENLRQNLNLENQLLENEIASAAAITRIASQSADIGFTAPKIIQYIR